MRNALSFDVEEWFHVHNFEKYIKYADWDKCESRIEIEVKKILDILDTNNTKATFFILGWIAERHPELIKEIDKKGHEIAIHGYRHRLVYTMTPKEFEAEISKVKKIIEKIIKKKVIGHRAPSFSITEKSMWALNVLEKLGFKYDSSIFPIIHPDYGIPKFGTNPKKIGKLMEFPMSTIKLLGKNIPVAGGGYLRTQPYWFTKWAIKQINKKQPAIVYIHPWELDPEHPKIKSTFLQNWRHRTGLRANEKKLKKLITDFKFTTVKDVLKDMRLV
jgi:polysaccharide deacetylase family protein (PEP-CTERM system associated)